MKPKTALKQIKKRKLPALSQCRPNVKRIRAALDGGLWKELAELFGERVKPDTDPNTCSNPDSNGPNDFEG